MADEMLRLNGEKNEFFWNNYCLHPYIIMSSSPIIEFTLIKLLYASTAKFVSVFSTTIVYTAHETPARKLIVSYFQLGRGRVCTATIRATLYNRHHRGRPFRRRGECLQKIIKYVKKIICTLKNPYTYFKFNTIPTSRWYHRLSLNAYHLISEQIILCYNNRFWNLISYCLPSPWILPYGHPRAPLKDNFFFERGKV